MKLILILSVTLFPFFLRGQDAIIDYKAIIEKALNSTNITLGLDPERVNKELEGKFPILIDNTIRDHIKYLKDLRIDNKEVIFKEPEYFALHTQFYFIFFNEISLERNKSRAFVEYIKVDKDKSEHKRYSVNLEFKNSKWFVVEKKVIPHSKGLTLSQHIGMVIYRYLQYSEERRNKKPEKTDLEIEKELLQKNKN